MVEIRANIHRFISQLSPKFSFVGLFGFVNEVYLVEGEEIQEYEMVTQSYSPMADCEHC